MDCELELLPCPLCRFPNFKDVHSLRSTLINVATTKLTCPVCSETLMGLDKLTIHLFSHMRENFNQNEQLQGSIQLDEVRQIGNSSMLMENNPHEKCETLNLDSTISRDGSIVCDICNFSFTDRNILELHQKLLHQTNPNEETGAYSFHCHLCSKKFKMRGSLIVHLRVAHYGFSHDSCRMKKTINTTNLSENGEYGSVENGTSCTSKIMDHKQWRCDICSKMFTTKYFLKKHKRLHTGEMPYTCTQCSKSFTFQQSFHKHMLYHSAEKPHTCNECGRSFKELSTLQNHARIHSGERPFACETCGKRFRQRVSYLVHRRIHTGVMPYDCKICGKKFRYKVSQRSHKCITESLVQTENNIEERCSTLYAGANNNNNVHTNDVQCILSVDHEGKISFIRKKDDSPSGGNEIEQVTSTMEHQNDNNLRENRNTDGYVFDASNPSTDFYSMLISPLLPEVESLCLSNSPNIDIVTPNDVHNQITNGVTQQYSSGNLYGHSNFLEGNNRHE